MRIRDFQRESVKRSREAFGHDWNAAQWVMALVGELGELANLLKKVERGDFTVEERGADIADELADVQAYLVLLSDHLGVDLENATKSKFNDVSRRVGYQGRL